MIVQVATIFHVIFAIILIGLVLLQQGKGADVGAVFGGSSQSVFGAAGANTFLLRATTTVAALFMCTSIFLTANAAHHFDGDAGVFKGVVAPPPTPAAPTTEASSQLPPAAAPVGTPPAEAGATATAAPAQPATPAAPSVATPTEPTAGTSQPEDNSARAN